MHLFRHSMPFANNPFIYLGLTFGSIIALHMTDYETNWALKNAIYIGFLGLMSSSLVPLIHMYGNAVMFEALIATGVTMGGLGMVAYNSPSQQFLNWGGPLAIGLGGMLGVSLLSMIYPGSPALTSIWLYGGLALFSAFVLYDTQMVIHRAKTELKYDPINRSLSIYLDAINIFVRMAQILGNKKR